MSHQNSGGGRSFLLLTILQGALRLDVARRRSVGEVLPRDSYIGVWTVMSKSVWLSDVTNVHFMIMKEDCYVAKNFDGLVQCCPYGWNSLLWEIYAEDPTIHRRGTKRCPAIHARIPRKREEK
jgi:hypothetical protein